MLPLQGLALVEWQDLFNLRKQGMNCLALVTYEDITSCCILHFARLKVLQNKMFYTFYCDYMQLDIVSDCKLTDRTYEHTYIYAILLYCGVPLLFTELLHSLWIFVSHGKMEQSSGGEESLTRCDCQMTNFWWLIEKRNYLSDIVRDYCLHLTHTHTQALLTLPLYLSEHTWTQQKESYEEVNIKILKWNHNQMEKHPVSTSEPRLYKKKWMWGH